MSGSSCFKEPQACSEAERQEFERLVRQGFDGSDERLVGRIRAARRLAFCFSAEGPLVAIAALKAPSGLDRDEVFEKASAGVSAASYEVELGWVFVVPAYRGGGIARRFCRELMASVPEARVFATTRPNNEAMIKILLGLAFARVGRPYRRRNEELALFLRN